MKKWLAAAGVVAIVVFVLARWTLGPDAQEADSTQIHVGTVDTFDPDSGVACLSSGDESEQVSCYPSAVGTLAVGQKLRYALTPARTDPRQDGSGSLDVITWIEVVD